MLSGQAAILLHAKRGECHCVWAIVTPSFRAVAACFFCEIKDTLFFAAAQCAHRLKLAKQQRIVFRKFRPVNLVERHSAKHQACIIEVSRRLFPAGFERGKWRHAVLPLLFKQIHHNRRDMEALI